MLTLPDESRTVTPEICIGAEVEGFVDWTVNDAVYVAPPFAVVQESGEPSYEPEMYAPGAGDASVRMKLIVPFTPKVPGAVASEVIETMRGPNPPPSMNDPEPWLPAESVKATDAGTTSCVSEPPTTSRYTSSARSSTSNRAYRRSRPSRHCS